jgi:acyl-coenzyme A thioesterase PaaI-like protein
VSAGGDELLAVWNACGYYRLVGMRVARADGAGSRLEIEIGAEHLQAYGTATEARDADGALVAVAQGTFARFPLPVAS